MPASAFQAIMGVNSLVNANTQANAIEASGEYQKKVSEMNARDLSNQATDEVKRGDRAALASQNQTARLAATQRVAGAALGLDVNSEVAQNIATNTEAAGVSDVVAIKTNAMRSAWGLENQASNTILAGETGNLAAQNTARNTMQTGVNEAAGYGLKAYSAYESSRTPNKENPESLSGGSDKSMRRKGVF